ncbi:MAG: hypothetical protein LLG04_09120 [Parachlamydia sp.]|nr:hypothetical protein [Parachlamydia sp.]
MNVSRVRTGVVNWWKELEKLPMSLPKIKSVAQNALSFLYVLKDIPKLKLWLPHSEKIADCAKFCEFGLSRIKEFASLCETPQKWKEGWLPKLYPQEKHVPKRCYRFLSSVQCSLEGFLTLHLWKKYTEQILNNTCGDKIKDNLLIDRLKNVKDGLTVASCAFNAFAIFFRERNDLAQSIKKRRKRLDPQGPLHQLKALLGNADLTDIQLNEINHLKSLHGAKNRDSRMLKLEKEIGNLEASKQTPESLKELRAKCEKRARMKVWCQQTQIIHLDRLREVVRFKIEKNQICIFNEGLKRDKLLAVGWCEIAKIVAVIFFNVVEFALLGTGQWMVVCLVARMVSNFATGILGMGKTVAEIRFENALIKQPHIPKLIQ